MSTITALFLAGLIVSAPPSDAIEGRTVIVPDCGACHMSPTSAPMARTQPSPPGASFLALDPFVGASQIWKGNPYDAQPEGDKRLGWEVGATVSFRRWMGVTGSFSRNTIADYTLQHFLVGPRFSTPFTYYATSAMPLYVRGFAHALFGRVSSRAPDGLTDSSGELVLGGGMDLLLLRLQFDYVRTNVTGLAKNNARAFVGLVVPLCIRGCRPDGYDGFEIGR